MTRFEYLSKVHRFVAALSAVLPLWLFGIPGKLKRVGLLLGNSITDSRKA
jgi:hypothetical protein